jgi:phage terminase Nu1 subunit (DNA packaging protein)
MTDVSITEGEIVNLGELEERLAGTDVPTSADTLKRLASRHGDFPVIARGSNGVAYRFDLAAVVAWLRRHRDAIEAERQAREAAVDQLAAAFQGEERSTSALSPSEQLKLLQVQKARRLEACERGELLDRRRVADGLAAIMLRLQKRITSAAKRAARDADMDHARRAELEEAVERALNDAVDAAQTCAREPSSPTA